MAEIIVFKLDIGEHTPQVHKVPTTLGQAHVLVVGDLNNPAIVTFHEAGLTPEQTFGFFFNAPRSKELTSLFSWYHIFAPGTEPNAPEWAGQYPTLDQIAAQSVEIIHHFKLSSPIIFGVGAGGNIAVRMAVIHPDLVKGIVLIGTTSRPANFRERTSTFFGSIESYVWKSAEVQAASSRLLRRFFSSKTFSEQAQLVSQMRSVLNSMSPNMLKFELTYENRDDVTDRLAKLESQLLFIVGHDSPHFEEQVESWEEFNQGPRSTGKRSAGVAKNSIVKVEHAGDLLTDEDPSQIYQPFALFVVGLGIHTQALMKIDYVFDVSAVPQRQESMNFFKLSHQKSAGNAESTVQIQ